MCAKTADGTEEGGNMGDKIADFELFVQNKETGEFSRLNVVGTSLEMSLPDDGTDDFLCNGEVAFSIGNMSARMKAHIAGYYYSNNEMRMCGKRPCRWRTIARAFGGRVKKKS